MKYLCNSEVDLGFQGSALGNNSLCEPLEGISSLRAFVPRLQYVLKSDHLRGSSVI